MSYVPIYSKSMGMSVLARDGENVVDEYKMVACRHSIKGKRFFVHVRSLVRTRSEKMLSKVGSKCAKIGYGYVIGISLRLMLSGRKDLGLVGLVLGGGLILVSTCGTASKAYDRGGHEAIKSAVGDMMLSLLLCGVGVCGGYASVGHGRSVELGHLAVDRAAVIGGTGIIMTGCAMHGMISHASDSKLEAKIRDHVPSDRDGLLRVD